MLLGGLTVITATLTCPRPKDHSEQRETLQRTLQAAGELKGLFDFVEDGIIVTDSRANIEQMNSTAANMVFPAPGGNVSVPFRNCLCTFRPPPPLLCPLVMSSAAGSH